MRGEKQAEEVENCVAAILRIYEKRNDEIYLQSRKLANFSRTLKGKKEKAKIAQISKSIDLAFYSGAKSLCTVYRKDPKFIFKLIGIPNK